MNWRKHDAYAIVSECGRYRICSIGYNGGRAFEVWQTRKHEDGPHLLAAFCDHHAAKGTVAKDWDATWRTWVRRALSYGYPMLRGSPPRTRIEPTTEELDEAKRRAAAENRRQLERLGLAATKALPS